MWRAAFKNGKRSYVRTDGQAKNWQQLGGRDRMHLELTHSSAGAWSDPVDIDSRELFLLKTEESPDLIRAEENIIR